MPSVEKNTHDLQPPATRFLEALYVPGYRRALAEVVDEGGRRVLVKRVRTDTGQWRRPPAWALNAAHLERAHELAVDVIRYVEVDDAGAELRVWSTTPAMFEAHGFERVANGERQVLLVLSRWSVDGDVALDAALVAQRAAADARRVERHTQRSRRSSHHPPPPRLPLFEGEGEGE